MAPAAGLTWQASLFDADEPAPDAAFATLVRHPLDATAWVDHAPGWLAGSDRLFAELLEVAPWAQRERRMYDRRLPEPRLTARWACAEAPVPVLREMAAVLSARYGEDFDTVGLNLYRHGRDSVAWHGDRVPPELPTPTVVLVSLGHPRRLLLRRKGGGPSTPFLLGKGDLLVMGGTSQRTWEDTVPKVARAGPRISVGYRPHAGSRPTPVHLPSSTASASSSLDIFERPSTCCSRAWA